MTGSEELENGVTVGVIWNMAQAMVVPARRCGIAI